MKIAKIIASIFSILLLVVALLLVYVKTAMPNVGTAPSLKLEYTPERIARGDYLANHVAVCMDCHSKRDWSKFSGPMVAGTTGQGGERFDQTVGVPGVYYSKNITPFGIARYTDGELFRVITTGVSKEGEAYFPLMPFSYYGRMDPEDIYCIISYLRSLKSIDKTVTHSVSDFPMNFLINTIPQKATPQKKPDIGNQLAYGEYMTNASGCRECHTKVERGRILPEFAFSGGRDFILLNGATVRSFNITPDNETGIGQWTEEQFVQRFKAYADSSARNKPVDPNDYNTVMPWTMYAGMKREDLTAIYAYLKTVKSIKNKVEKFSPAVR
ncbi:MAG: cytochrome C [Bacteroidetes bacterium]|nr:cytochrome C [Bacteroidota bacterium]MBS1540802.1 cytochrome C [Bacteroidota bacterium]